MRPPPPDIKSVDDLRRRGLDRHIEVTLADPRTARAVLLRAGLPPARLPYDLRAADFWPPLLSEIEQGVIEGGFAPLLSAIALAYPGNPHFAPWRPAASDVTDAHDAQTPSTERDEGGGFDVFFSYNSGDTAVVEHIARRLRERGVRPWFDRWDLPGGRDVDRVIRDAIERTPAMAVFFGANSLGPWQRIEANGAVSLFTAVRDARPLVPVLLPGTEALPPDAPLALVSRSWIRFASADDDDALARLVRALRSTT